MPAQKPQDLHTLFASALNSGDINSLVGLYEPSATLVPQPGQVATGTAAIRQALQAFVAMKPTIRLKTTFVLETGDVALLRGKWTIDAKGPDGQPTQMTGNSTEVVRRQHDGSWLYLIDHPYGAD